MASPPPAKTRRNNQDPETTRKEILQAALEVLAKDGPDGLNVTEVARRAGINRGTAYQHFPTREDLTHATTEWVGEQIYQAFYGDIEELTKNAGMYPPELALERLSSFAMDNPELSRAWLFDVMSTEGSVTDRFWKTYVKALEQFVEQGYGRKDTDVEIFTFIILSSALLWPIWAGAHAKNAKSKNKMKQRFSNEMLKLILFGALEPDRHPELTKRFSQKNE